MPPRKVPCPSCDGLMTDGSARCRACNGRLAERRRLDPTPLIEWFAKGGSMIREGNNMDTEIAELLGISRQRLSLWRSGTRISVWEADRLACHACHEHPSTLWGDEWWNAISDDLKDN